MVFENLVEFVDFFQSIKNTLLVKKVLNLDEFRAILFTLLFRQVHEVLPDANDGLLRRIFFLV